MAKDFKTGQIRTSKIIGKATEGIAHDTKIVFYTDSEAPDFDGGDPGIDLGGDDVSFVFAGEPGDHGVSTNGGVALFNGDVVISGTLYAENQVIQLDSDAPGGLKISGAVNSSPTAGTAIHIEDSGTLGAHNGWIVWDTGEAKIGEGENKLVLSGDDGIHEDSTILRNNTTAVSGSGPESWSSPNHIATCEDIEAHVSGEVAVVAADLSSVETRLANEESTRATDDTSLEARLSSEESISLSLDESLEDFIAAVVTDMDTYDLSLQTRLSNEESTRATDDASLEARLSTEESARSTADTSLQSRIQDSEDDIIEMNGDIETNSSIITVLAASGGGGGGNLTTKGDLEVFTTSQTRLGVGADGNVLTADSTAASGLTWAAPSGGGSISFTISDGAMPTAGAQTIEDGNTLTVTGAGGLTSAVTATDTLTITLDDMPSVTPSTYGDATNVPQLTVDQQGRITGVTNVAISAGGGSSSAGGSGEVQVSNGSGGFDAAAVFKYHPNVVPAESRVSISTGGTVTSPDARLEIVNAQADSFHCLRLEQLINAASPSTRSNMMPFLIESNTDNSTADVGIANKGTIGQIILANNFVSGVPPTYKSSTISLDDDDFKILNNENNGIVQVVGVADSGVGTPQVQYDVIRGEGNTAQGPCVTMLTDPSSPAAAIASPDINFYVDGVPGSLGSTGASAVKRSAQFGGDLQVDGFVSRGGIAHLIKDTNQTIIPTASDPSSSSWPGPGINFGPSGNIIFEGSLILDTNFYAFSSPQDYIELLKGGYYKVSYGAFTWQMYHANYANHPTTPGANIGERTAAKSLLRIDSGSGAVDVDNSYDCCYLRRDWINKWTFSATTIIQASAGDKLSLQLKWIQGNLPDACEFEVRSNQTWLMIEKVQ